MISTPVPVHTLPLLQKSKTNFQISVVKTQLKEAAETTQRKTFVLFDFNLNRKSGFRFVFVVWVLALSHWKNDVSHMDKINVWLKAFMTSVIVLIVFRKQCCRLGRAAVSPASLQFCTCFCWVSTHLHLHMLFVLLGRIWQWSLFICVARQQSNQHLLLSKSVQEI